MVAARTELSRRADRFPSQKASEGQRDRLERPTHVAGPPSTRGALVHHPPADAGDSSPYRFVLERCAARSSAAPKAFRYAGWVSSLL
jgi:hypothetical protein